MRDVEEKWALFWCSLLREVLFEEIEPKDINRFLKKIAQQEVLFPNGVRKTPSLSTLRRKLNAYRKGGFEALARQRRADRGQPRAHSKAVIEKAVEIKRDGPRRSHITINKFLQAEHKTTVPPSTLYRHLRRAGATRIKLGVSRKKVRKRWTRDHTHSLWLGDFEEGPYVLHEGNVVPTHLSAFIDCHSRFLVEGRYYFRQNLDILIDSFLRGLTTHGAPVGLYVDQAKVYQALALRNACVRLNIRLSYRGCGDPPPGGLIERFFETTQSQFEDEVRRGDILTLDQLNRAFSAWLEMSYHREPNSQTGQAPQERYEQGLTVIRHVHLETVLVYFMRREERTVHPDFSDVQLHNRFYRVDKRLRTDRVEVRYDPYSSMDTVLIYSRHGEYLGTGTLHNREEGETPTPPVQRKPRYNYLELLIGMHEKELQGKTQGIDYRRAASELRWPFPAFAKTLAQLLGRKGALAAFSSRELELLKKRYNRLPGITKPLLVEAFENAGEASLLAVLYQLHRLNDRKE